MTLAQAVLIPIALCPIAAVLTLQYRKMFILIIANKDFREVTSRSECSIDACVCGCELFRGCVDDTVITLALIVTFAINVVTPVCKVLTFFILRCSVTRISLNHEVILDGYICRIMFYICVHFGAQS